MERPKLEVADVFRRYGSAYRQQHAGSLSRGQRRVMSAIELCRTAALGGHLEQCDSCGHQRPAYHSCRNRHCPKCQSLARAKWLQDRQAELLPVEYSTSSSPCRKRLPPSPIRTKRWSTAFSFVPRPRPCAPSPLIPNTSARKSVFSPSFTVGDKTCSFTRTCIVWCRAGASLRTVSTGLPVVRDSSYLFACCPPASGACSSNICRRRLTPADSSSSLRWNTFVTRKLSCSTWHRFARKSGSCTPNDPSAVRNRC